jgi:hypothetical protein
MPNKNTVLCSKHFQPEDFEASAEHRQRRDLKRTAVPSIFDLPEHLQPKKVKLRKPPIGRVVDVQVEDATEVVPDVQADIAAEVKPSSMPAIDTVSLEHDYCLEDAKVLKTKLDRRTEQYFLLKKRFVAEKKKTHYLKKKNLTCALKSLKTKGLLESSSTEHVQSLVSPVLQKLVKRIERQKEAPLTEEYPPEIRIFASTLQFYSTKAYEYVRQTFSKAMPHLSTIRKWYGNIDGSPGFSTQALKLLEQKVKYAEEKKKPEVIVSLMLDDMSIKKQIDYDAKTSSFKGFVDLGTGAVDDDSKPATEALILMVVGVNYHFKIPIGYFFISGSLLFCTTKNDMRAYVTLSPSVTLRLES